MALKRPGNFRNPHAPRSGPQQAGIYYLRRTNRAARLIDDLGQPSWGTIGFSVNPSPGDNITLNGAVIVFGSDIPIGTDLKTTLASLVAYANANLPNAIFDLTGDATILILSRRLADTTYTLAASAATCSSTHLQLQQNRQRVGLISGLTYVNMNMGLAQTASLSRMMLSIKPTITLDLVNTIAPTNDHSTSATPGLGLVVSVTPDNSIVSPTAVMRMGLAETAALAASGVSVSATLDLGLSVAEMGNDSTYGLTAIFSLGLTNSANAGNAVLFGATMSLDLAETAALDHSQISVNATIDAGLTLAETVISGAPALIPATMMRFGVTKSVSVEGSVLDVATLITLGVTELVSVVAPTVMFAATMSLGVTEAAIVTNPIVQFSATIDEGLSAVSAGDDSTINVITTMSFGVSDTETVTAAVLSVATSFGLGVTETIAVSHAIDSITVTMGLGVTEAATATAPIVSVVATMGLGVTEAATATAPIDSVTATMRLGVTETATAAFIAPRPFIVGGDSGLIYYSADGKAYTAATSHATSYIMAIASDGASRIAYCSYDGKIGTSDDGGATWTLRSTPTGATPTLLCIAYGNGLWVIGTGPGEIWTSPDAASWVNRGSVGTNIHSTFSIYHVAYNTALGLWECGTQGGYYAYSTNGTSWTTSNTQVAGASDVQCIFAGPAKTFLGCAGQSHLWNTTDGHTWIQNSNATPGDVWSMVGPDAGGVYLIGGTGAGTGGIYKATAPDTGAFTNLGACGFTATVRAGAISAAGLAVFGDNAGGVRWTANAGATWAAVTGTSLALCTAVCAS